MSRKFSSAVVSVLTAAVCCAGCATTNREDAGSGDVRAVIRSKTSLLSHGSGSRVLEAGDRSFKNLYSAGYIWIPEWSSILFLTHREGGEYRLHIFSPDKKQDMTIKTDDLTFLGTGIGWPKTNAMTCFVEKVEGDVAVLVERGYRSPEIRFELNRAKKTLRLAR